MVNASDNRNCDLDSDSAETFFNISSDRASGKFCISTFEFHWTVERSVIKKIIRNHGSHDGRKRKRGVWIFVQGTRLAVKLEILHGSKWFLSQANSLKVWFLVLASDVPNVAASRRRLSPFIPFMRITTFNSFPFFASLFGKLLIAPCI